MARDVTTAAASTANAAFRGAQLALFRASALKQQKWRALESAIGTVTPDTLALDLGSDTGVISWLLRSWGGKWTSAELGEEAAELIQRTLDEPVTALDGPALPFPDRAFDLIVVIDLLEHLQDDAALLSELARCLRPGGRLVLNVPHAKRLSMLRPLRHAIGLTDEWHGHVHAGYTAEGLKALLPKTLRMTGVRSYSRFFSHALDTALNWVFLRTSRGRVRRSPKGMLVSGGDAKGASGGAFRRLGPAMRAFVALDGLLPWAQGYMLLVTAERIGG